MVTTAWSGMTKHWQDFQFPFSRNCQIVLLDEIKSSCVVKYFNSSYLSPCGSWSRPVQYLIWSIRDPSLNVPCVASTSIYVGGWCKDGSCLKADWRISYSHLSHEFMKFSWFSARRNDNDLSGTSFVILRLRKVGNLNHFKGHYLQNCH